jgi:hypothetical protein
MTTLNIGTAFITIACSWEELKAFVNRDRLRIRSREKDGSLHLFAIDNPIVYLCTLYRGTVPHAIPLSQEDNDAAIDDFETNFEAVANLSVTRRNEDGNTIVAPTHTCINESWRMEGIRFTASGQTTTIYDYHITKEILMQGGHWWTSAHGLDDSADFSIIDKDDILGLHTLYDLPPGYPIELKKFVKNYHIPSGLTTGTIQAPTVSPVVSGLYVRIAYDNNSDENAEIGVNYIYYEKA